MREKILIVDDDPLVLRTLEHILTREGYWTMTAVSGPDAIRKAEEKKYQLIIMDMRMSGMDGIETAERIKAVYDQKGIETKFIFVTGYAEDDVPQHAHRLGITEVLLKPFDINHLLPLVQSSLAGDIKPMEAAPPSFTPPVRWIFPQNDFRYEKLVTVQDLSFEGNVYFTNYFMWQGEAREALLLSHPDFDREFRVEDDVKMITHSSYQRFLHEAHFGDRIEIKITSREIKKCSFVLLFRFYNKQNHAFLAEGWQRIAFACRKTGRICPIPGYVLDLVVPIEEQASAHL